MRNLDDCFHVENDGEWVVQFTLFITFLGRSRDWQMKNVCRDVVPRFPGLVRLQIGEHNDAKSFFWVSLDNT